MRVRSGEEEESHVYAYKSVRIQDKKKPHVHSLRACAQGGTYKATGRSRCCTEAILDDEHPKAATTGAQQHGYRDPKLLNAHNVERALEPMVLHTT